MKIFHTSDLHLREDRPERIKALTEILKLARQEKIDLLLIAGDMFDSDKEADKLRPKLRKMFSGNPFVIRVIPGNHDEKAFRKDHYMGEDVNVYVIKPFETEDFEDVRIVAVPYFDAEINTLISKLKDTTDSCKTNILLIHCSLDIPYIKREDFGEEQKHGYMPVSSAILADAGFDYIMAGHFHSRFMENRISEKCSFIYPGSPVSITKKEQGKRCVNFLDTKKSILKPLEINSFYYETISVIFDPFDEEKGITYLENEIKKHDLYNAEIEINLYGFIKTEEVKFKQMIDVITRGIAPQNINHGYKNIKSLLEDSLYKKFEHKLKKLEINDESKQQIRSMVLNAFSNIKALEG